MKNKKILEEIEHLHLRIKTIEESKGSKLVKDWYINLYKEEIENLRKQTMKGCEI